jgi:predicted ATP-grasp superfamily ATP-dependent carboligase
MHSSLLAKSPNSAGLVLVAAVSGRALAQAARRAGYCVRVADFFGDDDTLAASESVTLLPGHLREGVDADRLVGVLGKLAEDDLALTRAAGRDVDALILGSGFERLPDLVDELATHFPLAGNRGSAIRRVKDPQTLASDCADIGIPHPEFCWDKPSDPDSWISKRVGGAGGVHVQNGSVWACHEQRYFQRRIEGRSISALFVADGDAAHVVGFSRQWTSPSPHAPYRYGGAVRLRRLDRDDAVMIGGWLSALTRKAALVGLCSADFICSRDGYRLIELNPRPGSTLDIFDSEKAPLLKAHVNACWGEPFELPRFSDSAASVIAYTSEPIRHFPLLDWPDWTADRQAAGSRLDSGDPVCTVFAAGRSAAEARRGVYANLRQMERAWGGGHP